MPVSVASLTTRIRRRAKDENSEFATDDEIRDLINVHACSLYDKLIAARGPNYYRRTLERNTVPGTYLYALPTDFYELVALFANEGQVVPDGEAGEWGLPVSTAQSGWSRLYPFLPADQAFLMNHGGGSHPCTWRYSLTGEQAGPDTSGGQGFEIRPTPTQVATLRIEYIPRCILPAGPEDDFPIDGINGWEEWVVRACAVDLLGEEEVDATASLRVMADLERRITALASQRDASMPQRVQDTRRGRMTDGRARGWRGPGGVW